MESYSGIPVVDFSALGVARSNARSGPDTSSAEVKELVRAINKEFSTVGAVYLKNHGVSQELIDEALNITGEFFALRKNVKNRYAKGADKMHGWDALESERPNVERPGDLKESFDCVAVEEESTLWPEDEIPAFKPTVRAYYHQLKSLALRILSAIAIGLDMDPNTFEPSHRDMGSKDINILRFNYYPEISGDIHPKPGQIRCGEHSDYGSITILHQDDVGGLEIALADGSFVPVTPIKDTLLVNISDMMQRWTADKLRSPIHRVIEPKDGTANNQSSRRSIVFFLFPTPDAPITCLDGSNKYPEITAGEYLENLLKATYN